MSVPGTRSCFGARTTPSVSLLAASVAPDWVSPLAPTTDYCTVGRPPTDHTLRAKLKTKPNPTQLSFSLYRLPSSTPRLVLRPLACTGGAARRLATSTLPSSPPPQVCTLTSRRELSKPPTAQPWQSPLRDQDATATIDRSLHQARFALRHELPVAARYHNNSPSLLTTPVIYLVGLRSPIGRSKPTRSLLPKHAL